MKKVSSIFKNKPDNWLLRADPLFWNHLEKKFDNYNLPMAYEEFEKIVKDEYFELTNIRLNSESNGICEEFTRGTIASGTISGKFWVEIALPMLKQRLEKNSSKNPIVNFFKNLF